ncbi:hypothetical protein [Stenotrophomonas sp.]|uniref:hypothetical protein n=1 Tax=Stenotrophomonas sp. TaxID=69392 RepID=UPI0028A7DE38|nr:hypothetical protein [Stenotrophomonas sp.]
MTRTPKIVLLTLALSTVPVGCGKTDTPARDATAPMPATTDQATTYTLAEATLPA